MSIMHNSSSEIPWWKEPTKEQWKAWIAAWLGWTLDAFDFTIFLLIMVPIAKEFDVPLGLPFQSWLRSASILSDLWQPNDWKRPDSQRILAS